MKKILFALTVLGFASIVTFKTVNASASFPEKNDPFWTITNQLHDPADALCLEKATAVYAGIGQYGDGSAAATGACTGFSAVLTMEGTLSAAGVRTNLFDDVDNNGVLDHDWREIQHLFFEVPSYGKIEFTRPINFMNYDFLMFITSFADRLEMSRDYIALDADIVNGMNGYGAVLTMYNVSNFDNPEILVNESADEGDVVSGFSYDSDQRTIVFDAAHFSSFRAVEKSADNKKARVSSWSAKQYTKPGAKCENRLKITVKGKRFDKDAEVRIGGKKAVSVNRKSSRELVAAFCSSDLTNIQTADKRSVTVTNPHTDKDKADKKIDLRQFLGKWFSLKK